MKRWDMEFIFHVAIVLAMISSVVSIIVHSGTPSRLKERDAYLRCGNACPLEHTERIVDVSFYSCEYDAQHRLIRVSKRSIEPPYQDGLICEIRYAELSELTQGLEVFAH